MKKPQVVVITGEIESGKTSLCRELDRLARLDGIKSAGLISPAVFEAGSKTAIDVQDLTSGERRRLADLRERISTGLETRRWSFHPDAVAWGNQILQRACPCDLLIIDELGPLEFNRAEGWISALEIVDQGQFQTALLVIRPDLVGAASRRWQVTRILDLSGSGPFPKSPEDFLASLDLGASA